MKKTIALLLMVIMCLSLIASAANSYTYTYELDFKEVQGKTLYLKKNQRVEVTVKQTGAMYQYIEDNTMNAVVFWYKEKDVKTEVKTKLYYSINDSNNKNIKGGSWSGLKNNGKQKSFSKKIPRDGYYTIAISNQTKENAKYEYILPKYQMTITIK